jgi:hypothetical protein
VEAPERPAARGGDLLGEGRWQLPRGQLLGVRQQPGPKIIRQGRDLLQFEPATSYQRPDLPPVAQPVAVDDQRSRTGEQVTRTLEERRHPVGAVESDAVDGFGAEQGQYDILVERHGLEHAADEPPVEPLGPFERRQSQPPGDGVVEVGGRRADARPQGALEADQRRPVGLAVFVEPVGEHEARRIVVGRSADRFEEGVTLQGRPLAHVSGSASSLAHASGCDDP